MDHALPPSTIITISHEDFCLFHKMDRKLYWILVINLYRNPTESMQVLAMWLWLERLGYRHLVKKITSLPYTLINEVADETLSCLKYINATNFSYFSYSIPFTSEPCDISLLQSIVDKEISSQSLYDNKDYVLQGVAGVMNSVCVRAFSDIMQHAITGNTIEKKAESQRNMSDQSAKPPQQQQQKPLWFGSIAPSNLHSFSNMVQGGASHDHQIHVHNLAQENINIELVPADERTLFLTFSKGYPVEESEVREFFTKVFDDSVEALYMQEVQPNEQPLFARMIFRNKSTINMIIGGSSKAKLSINGKHVWARRFVPKRT
ncbi:hypothetical protein TanjilG_32183 [Lupinus angustifolius]|uniref:RRM domain-containing protein n=2 Tax=Lupinus angustifolius TaxID=3871 RepID=A0A1J7HUL7_LUPAN|nr:PREDICTED: uncharacterized protein LOC109338898 [Lupinus angustifolius]OIW16513.1 hypothetical protein TanjilG_32183 [Lupinus angustifolius]